MKNFLLFYLTLSLPYLACGQSKATLSEKRDTVIIIPLGATRIASSAVTKVTGISTGMYHFSVLNEKGEVQTWVDPAAYSIDVPYIGEPLSAIATGDIHSSILYKDGTINQYFLSPRLTMFFPYRLQQIVQIASGPKMSVALNKKGILYTWGAGKTVKKLQIPIKTYGVKLASVGREHVAFINIKDRVFVWGDHSLGQNQIPKFSAKPVKIVSGDYHSMVLDAAGKVYAWGNNSKGQCNVPDLGTPAREIAAKNFLSMAVLENEKVVIWGMHKKTELNFSALGRVKTAALGNDYAVIVVETDALKRKEFVMPEPLLVSEPPAIPAGLDSSAMEKMLLADSLTNYMKDFNAENFMRKSVYENFSRGFGKDNSLEFESNNSSYSDSNSTTEVIFEGEGNKIKVIHDNVNVKRTNSRQRVIIKGSGKALTLHYKDQQQTIQNNDQEIVIDLDQVGSDFGYPEEYSDLKELETVTPEMIIEFDSLPNSYLTEWPVENGYYYSTQQGVLAKANEKNKIVEEGMFLSDPFEKAQAYFYCGQIANGIEALEEASADDYNYNCILALFEIHYYGLFGMPTSLPKAGHYFRKYQQAKAKY